MKQILIVGGGGGLGGALVKQLLDESYKVVVIGRTEPRDKRVQKFYPIDAVSADWWSLYWTIGNETSMPLDAVVFVAGTAVFGKTALIPLDRARQTFELNFWACTTAARVAAEYWASKNQAGKFVAILSIVARRAIPFEAYYSASKAATERFLDCLQFEYAHRNIKFVCAFPGMLRTSFRRQSEWYGIEPASAGGGTDAQITARAVIELLTGKRTARVIGWRERSLDLTDRVFPGLYDRIVLQRRVRRVLKK